jgi:NADP-dependent 3-hydroxy acid dehydrogenase YdfG
MPNETNPMNEQAFKDLFKYEPDSVKGKGVVVTGGTTGLGRAIAMLLVARGANVLIFGRHQKELDAAIADIKRVGGGSVYGMVADSSKPDDVKGVFASADRDLRKVDIVINNAALAAKSILDMDIDEWKQVLDVNLLGYLLVSRQAADRFRKQKSGHLVNIGSMSAKVMEVGSDIYVATKSGIRGFTDSLAKQLNEDGIRVTLIEPGLVGSDMTLDQVKKEEQSKKQDDQEMMKAEELAHAVLYAVEQPQRCSVAVIQIRPTKQII